MNESCPPATTSYDTPDSAIERVSLNSYQYAADEPDAFPRKPINWRDRDRCFTGHPTLAEWRRHAFMIFGWRWGPRIQNGYSAEVKRAMFQSGLAPMPPASGLDSIVDCLESRALIPTLPVDSAFQLTVQGGEQEAIDWLGRQPAAGATPQRRWVTRVVSHFATHGSLPLPRPSISVIMDDYFGSTLLPEACLWHRALLYALLDTLGCSHKEEKDQFGQAQVFSGVEIDTVKSVARIPAYKFKHYHQEMLAWRTQIRASRKASNGDVAKFGGWASHMAPWIPTAKAFVFDFAIQLYPQLADPDPHAIADEKLKESDDPDFPACDWERGDPFTRSGRADGPRARARALSWIPRRTSSSASLWDPTLERDVPDDLLVALDFWCDRAPALNAEGIKLYLDCKNKEMPHGRWAYVAPTLRYSDSSIDTNRHSLTEHGFPVITTDACGGKLGGLAGWFGRENWFAPSTDTTLIARDEFDASDISLRHRFRDAVLATPDADGRVLPRIDNLTALSAFNKGYSRSPVLRRQARISVVSEHELGLDSWRVYISSKSNWLADGQSRWRKLLAQRPSESHKKYQPSTCDYSLTDAAKLRIVEAIKSSEPGFTAFTADGYANPSGDNTFHHGIAFASWPRNPFGSAELAGHDIVLSPPFRAGDIMACLDRVRELKAADATTRVLITIPEWEDFGARHAPNWSEWLLSNGATRATVFDKFESIFSWHKALISVQAPQLVRSLAPPLRWRFTAWRW